MLFRVFVSCCMLVLAVSSCKKESNVQATSLKPLSITGLSKTLAQAGDTIVIKGANLQQGSLSPEVLINGRPAKVLDAAADKIHMVVPDQTKTGTVLVLLGNASVEGPSLTIVATPVINSYSPRFVVLGDTLHVLGEHFATTAADNQLYVDGHLAAVVTATATELKVLVPVTADSGKLSIGVYNGPLSVYKGIPVLLRKQQYEASSIYEWISKDPGFTFLYKYIAANQQSLAGNVARDTLMAYLTGERKGTMFIPNNTFAYDRGFSSEADFIRQYRYYDVFDPLLAATHDTVVSGGSWKRGYKYVSRLTGEALFWTPGSKTFFKVDANEGVLYLNTLSYGYPLGDPIRVLREVAINGSVMYEIAALPQFDSQPGEY